MKQPRVVRDLLRRAGFDIGRWPRRPDDFVMDWALARVLRTHKVNCVMDVGGNLGHFAQLIRALGYTGRIVSYEPSPTALPTLRKAAAHDPSWLVRPIGLSAKPGNAELHLHVGSEFDSLHPALPGAATQIQRLAEVDTATITLSTVALEFTEAVAGLPRPRVLLKSDTQGHDLEVIAGAEGLPPEVVAVLVELSAQPLYENQPRMTSIIDALQDEGFAPVAFQPISREESDDLRMIELDGLFMRPMQS
jgi:FkbM family methyltransferase